jgi:UDP-N-acetyl-D-mannosaminuronic acid dehydrogenase
VAKLLTNAWRYMKFAVANSFFMVSHSAGVDYSNVLHAIRHDYPRAADLPGPGFAAGPCLLKDTMQVAAFARNTFALGQAAMSVNEGLPQYIVDHVQRRMTLTGKTVGILGMAFKPESDDTRASLSYKLRKLLDQAGATVLCTDPYVTGREIVPLDRVLHDAEVLFIGVPHPEYRGLDVAGREVIDVWGAVTPTIRV